MNAQLIADACEGLIDLISAMPNDTYGKAQDHCLQALINLRDEAQGEALYPDADTDGRNMRDLASRVERLENRLNNL